MLEDLNIYIKRRKQALERAKKQYEELSRIPGKESEAFNLLVRMLIYVNTTLKELVTRLPKSEADNAKTRTKPLTPKLIAIPKSQRIH